MSYIDDERTRAAAWKRHTATLPPEARVPAPYTGRPGAPYDFCLPAEHAAFSLLPEVRDDALALFTDERIPWHHGVDGGPSNHLLSSQVQCVNALGQMVLDPVRIVRAFGELLQIDEVLEIEPGRHLTFEYIGPTNFFGEHPFGRGAHCTSLDAAFRHRAGDGVTELVLVEWKYTESYRRRVPDARRDATRLGRYGAALDDPSGPVRDDVLAFEHLCDEPLYQLVRQQLLAHKLETSGDAGAGRVRVVHVSPAGNTAYQTSLHRSEQRALGSTVTEVWAKLLRRHDRFTSVDSELFLDPDITSREYGLRYASDVVGSSAELLSELKVSTAADVEDALQADGHIVVDDDGLELVNGSVGTRIDYPFRMSEVHELVAEVEG